MSARAVPEWIGETPDTAIPRRVRVRVFTLADGHCAICTRKIAAGHRWVCDHRIALINGGENRESNLQVLCDWCDRKVKTPFDVSAKSRVARKRAKHLGARRSSRPMPGSKASGIRKRMSGEVEKW